MRQLKPIGDKILVATVPPPTTKHGLLLPDNYFQPTEQGVVIALGNRATGLVAVGDRVLLPASGMREVIIDRRSYRLVQEKDIPGVL